MSQINSVYTAVETARSVRKLIEARLNEEVEVSVTSGDSVKIVFREISQTTAVGTTKEGYAAIVSLGDEDQLDSKHPTIVVGPQSPA